MSESIIAGLKPILERILTAPTAEDVWQIQKDLLAIGGEAARQARTVAGAFHSCLRNMQSKRASRSASRQGAALGTAAIARGPRLLSPAHPAGGGAGRGGWGVMPLLIPRKAGLGGTLARASRRLVPKKSESAREAWSKTKEVHLKKQAREKKTLKLH